jgi:EAL domain-containing protein (putative c-di-GMP-specific phosphodiesterase class I)/CheY-like chemotaxis protein
VVSLSNNQIYLLDDDPAVLSLLLDIVEVAGLEAQPFLSGQDFFEKITKFEQETLLVLDLNMPSMDGIEVMRRLATMASPPALLLISGHDISVLHAAEKLGREHQLDIIASLNKPLRLSDFQKILQSYCIDNKGKVETNPVLEKELIVIGELQAAFENEQMVLFYQPQISIKTGECVSCEALIRWLHPSRGLIFPDEFIKIAEVHGDMKLLTNWVISTAVKDAMKWQQEGRNIPISINVSADNIRSLALPEQVSEQLENNKLTPSMITIEVTESALMGELTTSLDILTRLRLKGIGISIDDFGTGYSSLSLLHKIPFSELKIDNSFVLPMLEDKEACAIVKTCIVLGHELGMEVVAEGVESKAHLQALADLGCDFAQGYYFSRPVAEPDFIKWLDNSNKNGSKLNAFI